jgi:hypothetical protein
MGPKLLFVMGILLAHGALGAAWLKDARPQARLPVASCVKAPGSLPDLSPRREILAMLVAPSDFEESLQP